MAGLAHLEIDVEAHCQWLSRDDYEGVTAELESLEAEVQIGHYAERMSSGRARVRVTAMPPRGCRGLG